MLLQHAIEVYKGKGIIHYMLTEKEDYLCTTQGICCGVEHTAFDGPGI